VDVPFAPRHDIVVYDRALPGAAPLSHALWRAKLAEAERWRTRVAAACRARAAGEACRACGTGQTAGTCEIVSLCVPQPDA